MRQTLQKLSFAGTLLGVGLWIGGCTSAVAVWPEAQSRVTYPYDKIVAMGEARASTTGYDISWSGIPDFIDPQLGKEAVQKAIRVKRGDLLIDYTLSLYLIGLSSPFNVTMFNFPLIPNFWIITWTAEGTAAKLENAETQPSAQPAEQTPASSGERP